ncbi:hypothetical protein AWN57_07915 [Enterococcus faecium]|nr:hypothetical protein AWN57_07915 [Enterococcus faecium]
MPAPARLDAILARMPATVVPAWVLPFLRLRAAASGDPARAWAELPGALPAGVVMPSLDEAAAGLMFHGGMK